MPDHTLARAATPARQAAADVPAIAGRLKALRCLCAVATHGSATRAADELALSQGAVARALLQLEAACGVRLFDRGPRGMQATVPGARSAQRAQALFSHLALGAQEALALAPPQTGRPHVPERFAAAVSTASLRALFAVAAAGSQERAAQYLQLSQPAVNRALGHLEHLLGARLLRRSMQGMRLTEAGEALLRRMKLALAEAYAIESELAAWRGELRGRVVIGKIPFCAAPFLPHALVDVAQRHPGIEITVVDGSYDTLIRQLRDADIHVLIGALRDEASGLLQYKFFDEALVVIVRAGHPCLHIDAPTLADLQRWAWVLPLPESPASRLLHAAHVACGLPAPRAAVRSNSPTFTRTMVAGSDWLALTPQAQAQEDERSGLYRRVPVALPGGSRAVGATTRRVDRPSPDLAAVVDALQAAAASGKP